MSSSAERMRRLRARKDTEGMTTLTLMVPHSCIAELQLVAELLRGDRDLRPGPLRNERTGKLRGLKQAK